MCWIFLAPISCPCLAQFIERHLLWNFGCFRGLELHLLCTNSRVFQCFDFLFYHQHHVQTLSWTQDKVLEKGRMLHLQFVKIKSFNVPMTYSSKSRQKPAKIWDLGGCPLPSALLRIKANSIFVTQPWKAGNWTYLSSPHHMLSFRVEILVWNQVQPMAVRWAHRLWPIVRWCPLRKCLLMEVIQK
jgi:hypothetical protein